MKGMHEIHINGGKNYNILPESVLTRAPFFGDVSHSLLNPPYTLQLFRYTPYLVQWQKQLFI